MECLLPYLCMVTVPHIMIGLERMLDYRGVRLERFHCIVECIVIFYVYGICKYYCSILNMCMYIFTHAQLGTFMWSQSNIA